jgi:hypothetical protein
LVISREDKSQTDRLKRNHRGMRGSITVLSLSAVLGLCALATPVQATLLKGYVNENQTLEGQTQTGGAEQSTLNGAIQAESFPASYEGTWQIQTEVTDSAVETVQAGQKMISNIDFVRKPDGRIVANWNQPGWTETKVSIKSYSTTEAMTDRTTYYYGERMNGSWAARSRDSFTQIEPHKMIAKSYVDQYIDGQYLGRYRTKSVLFRSGDNKVALNEK